MTRMTGSPVQQEEIARQISLFRSREGSKRRQARMKLTTMGTPVIPALIECLHDEEESVRWEAARTLRDMPDPSAAEELVNTLPDPVPEVRWLAAEALIEMGENALKPLLRGLLEHFDSVLFRESAHHVLSCFEADDRARESFATLLESFRGSQPEEAVSMAAYRALGTLYGTHDVLRRKEPGPRKS
jgi:HEAT repeat protein